MQSLEADLEEARQLAVDDLADVIESIGFECTRCGACCRGHGEEDHTATVFPDEVRALEEGESYDGDYDWRDVARPMPYGLSEGDDGLEGETFEWALQTDGCGDCTFYEEDESGTGACTAHEDRPLICRTYPFSIALAGTSQPMGEAVDSVALEAQREAGEAGDEAGIVRAHECEGLGRDISRADARELARALKERAVRELEEAIAVRDEYEPADPDPGEVVVHDSEGAKRIDGTPREE
ncbi:YkgJ family cysteine cluster protein [Natrinema longum]|uniref:YkgJ family cysteine cluster protein n=1 Tax=Natrinema longum TaxID=370324 RepID=A0A8A2U870_9EURY|nr:YkgJ family cysteine cluster protein [Natrinema longum]MBZ6493809.1 YkgJ family cysteine cluster protein [Natrinema longum]QSW84854.1 YkgJ family cysteine cluster protein [Natrinema longum]